MEERLEQTSVSSRLALYLPGRNPWSRFTRSQVQVDAGSEAFAASISRIAAPYRACIRSRSSEAKQWKIELTPTYSYLHSQLYGRRCYCIAANRKDTTRSVPRALTTSSLHAM